MRRNAQQLVDEIRRAINETADDPKGNFWGDTHILDCIRRTHEDLVEQAADAAQDYFAVIRPIDLVAGQAIYPLFDDFIRLRLVERPAGSGGLDEPTQLVEGRKTEGVGRHTGMVMLDSGGSYALYGDDMHIDPPPTEDETGGLVQYLIVEPPPPQLDLAAGGSTNTIILASSADPEDDIFNGTTIDLVAGTGINQRRKITDYVGATRTGTVDSNWTTIPDTTSKYATISRLPRLFHSMLVTGPIIKARNDRDEDAKAYVAEWNSQLENFLAHIEHRTMSQMSVPVFDPFDGI